MWFPHSNYVIITVNTINISWKLDFCIRQMLDIFPTNHDCLFDTAFLQCCMQLMSLFPLLHFLRANLNLLRDNFIIVKTSPCLGLPMSLHVRYSCRAASWSSFTCSFQPGTITSLTKCLSMSGMRVGLHHGPLSLAHSNLVQ